MIKDKELIAVFHYDDGIKMCGAEPYRYAEEIVRCKNCIHWDRERAKRNSIQFMGYCILHSGYCSGNKYCAWGERSE